MGDCEPPTRLRLRTLSPCLRALSVVISVRDAVGAIGTVEIEWEWSARGRDANKMPVTGYSCRPPFAPCAKDGAPLRAVGTKGGPPADQPGDQALIQEGIEAFKAGCQYQ
jgi:hypothetical protein